MNNSSIEYLQRIRKYYLTLGYEKPYEWAKFDRVPFTLLNKPLAECRIGLVSTGVLYQPQFGDQGPAAPYNAAAKFYSVYSAPTKDNPDVRISHVGYDRKHTDASDQNTWFPLQQLKEAVNRGRIDAVSSRFYGLPTNRSLSTTLQTDCSDLLTLAKQDHVDAMLLVPNCPVCHQSCSLAARHLEDHGIATLVMGCAKDIVEHVGVPRFLFSDFPLGNAAGKPHDVGSQQQTLEFALDLLSKAIAPRTTFQSPLEWSRNHQWKLDFYNIDNLSEEEILKRRQDFDTQKKIAKNKKRDHLIKS